MRTMMGDQLKLWYLLLLTAGGLADSTTSKALSIPPSGYWQVCAVYEHQYQSNEQIRTGNDGPWSTFFINIGTPAQTLQLIPGTSASAGTAIWPIIPIGCSGDDGNGFNPNLTDCAKVRGSLFHPESSTSWSTKGLENGNTGAVYSLNTVEEGLLNLIGQGSYGYDTVSLGVAGQGLPTLQNQIIAGIGTNDYFVGSLGLSPLPMNFTTFNNPVPSLVGSLRNQSLIPSSSWAYTAGARYKEPPVYGSLTIGGYDASRFQTNNLTMSFGADLSRDLLLRLSSIKYDTLGTSPLLASGIDVFIDSMVTDLWLPKSVCDSFAQAFKLTYNSQSGRYLVNDTTYKSLTAQSPTFTFTVGQAGGGGQTVDISIPYAAFDLVLTAPITGPNTTQRYFPIRRADNSTQYTLGRTFLQEAYVIADYDRRNFSVSQALFPSTSVSQRLVDIQAPDGGNNTKKSSGISAGAIVGIVLGVLALLILLALAGRRWRKRRKIQSHTNGLIGLGEQIQHYDYKAVEEDHPHEVSGSDSRWEADGRAMDPELPVNRDGLYELEQPHQVYEMWTRDNRYPHNA